MKTISVANIFLLSLLTIFSMAAKGNYGRFEGTEDALIVRKIHHQIDALDRLSLDARNIEVSVVEGRVLLKGSVRDPYEKRLILQNVASVDGVWSIIDQMQINESMANRSQPSE